MTLPHNKPITLETKAVADNRKIKTDGGEYREIDISGGRYVENRGIYYEGDYNQSQSLADAAAEIQKLLKQLEQSYPTDTTTGKMSIATEVINRIDSNPTLTGRILSSLKAGSIQALAQALNHPAASFVIAALEDWQKSKKS